MIDFLRLATEAMTDEEEGVDGQTDRRAPGERGRDEEERETVSLLREAATLCWLIHTPTFYLLFFTSSVSGRSTSQIGSEIAIKS